MQYGSKLAKLGSLKAPLLSAAIIAGSMAAVWQANSQQFYGEVIRKIELVGNKNTEKDEILDAIEPMKVGQKLTHDLVNQAMKNLFQLGYFKDVRIQAGSWDRGLLVRILLQELPKIEEIEFIGTDKVYENDLLDMIELKEGDPIREPNLNRAREMILQKYHDEGLFLAYIKVLQTDYDEVENTADITFLIDEGEDIVINKINILGAFNVDQEDILDALESKEDGIIDDGTFKESIFAKDKQTILDFYKERGYLDVELVGSRWDIKWRNSREKDERVIHLSFNIKEGEQYFFNGIDIEHDPNYLSPTLNKGITDPAKRKPVYTLDEIEEYMEYTDSDIGDVFNNSKFSRDRGIINFLYSQKGYIYTRVVPRKKVLELTKEGLDTITDKEEQKTLHIEKLRDLLESSPELKGRKFVYHHFTIQEGDLAYIENIIIKGNKKTLDKVIRRELLVEPGELFNSALVQRSRERVMNLGFFKEVNLDMRPGSEDGKMNLIISVDEQPTGTISLGGGFGTQTGFSIFTEVAENNLNGTGQRISGRVEFGPQRKALETSWTEPWLFDKPWSLTLSAFYISRLIEVPSIFSTILGSNFERTNYSKNSVGFGVGVGHRFWINWGHYHRYSPVFSVASEPTGLVPDYVLEEVNLGWQFKSTVTNGIYYDSRDNIFNTTEGFRVNVEAQVVGNVFGGDDHYNRYTPEFQFYFWPFDFTFFNLIRSNTLRRWRTVFEVRGSASFTHTTGPLYGEQRPDKNPYIQSEDLLILGGYESLRGWRLFDPFFPAPWQDGGMHRLLFGAEYRIPVEPTLLWFVFFFDSGALYENEGDQQFVEEFIGQTVSEKELEKYYLAADNLSLSRFRYSYGFGIRLQIPILPLRLYLAKRLVWDPVDGGFRHPNGIGGDSFEFVFGIGDRRF